MSPLALVIIASVLLLFPLWVFRAPGSRLGAFDQRGWPTGRNLVVTIVDVLRASLGAGVLIKGLLGMAEAGRWTGWRPEIALAVGLGLALLVQTLVWRDEDSVHAPVGFLLGALVALVHPIVLALVLPVAIGAPLALRAWAPCFLGTGVGLIGVGMLIELQDWRRTLLLGVVVTLPVLVSVMAGRHMGAARE
ncbi:MAG: hypothetical protein H7067_09750 [Burkholderiales bacterium]|nr:hypothetical protein [Opitutaceae bacterium]